jgi:hypothetical protein
MTIIAAMVLGYALNGLVDAGLTYAGIPSSRAYNTGPARLAERVPAKIAAITELIDHASDTERVPIVAAADPPQLRKELDDKPPSINRGTDANTNLLHQRIQAALTAARLFTVAKIEESKDKVPDASLKHAAGSIIHSGARRSTIRAMLGFTLAAMDPGDARIQTRCHALYICGSPEILGWSAVSERSHVSYPSAARRDPACQRHAPGESSFTPNYAFGEPAALD